MKQINLAEIRRHLRKKSALAIQLKSGSMLVSFVKYDGETQVAHSFTVPFGADAIAANPEKTGAEFAEQLRKEGLREKRCVVCIPPGWTLSASTDLPEISDEDLRGYLELQAEREFPMQASEMRLAHCTYFLPDGKRRATIVAAPAKRLGSVEQMLENAGCRLVSLSLGLDRFIPAASAPGAMHFLANGTHVDLIIAAGGGIAALRSLSGSVTQENDLFDVANFCREVRITLGGLPDAVRQQVREAHFGGPRSTAELLCTKTRDQLRRMGVDPAGIDRGTEGDRIAFEAAEHYLQDQPVAFEFLPPQVKRWQALVQRFDNRRRRMLIAGAVALLLLPILAFVIRSKMESGLEADWTRMEGKVADLEKIQGNIRQFRPWFDPVPENLTILEGIIAAFPDQGDVWAKSIQIADASASNSNDQKTGEGTKVTCVGFARSQASLLALLERLRAHPEVSNVQVQSTRGDSPIQFTLALKWETSHARQ